MHKTVPVLALLLAGCTVDGTPRLTALERAASAGAGLPVAFDPAAPPETRQLAASLAAALGSRAAPAGAIDGPVLLVATSRAPAAMGLAAEGKASDPVRWLSQPRQGRAPCRVERLHASVTGPDMAAHGEVDYCKLDEARIDALGRRLAAAVRGT